MTLYPSAPFLTGSIADFDHDIAFLQNSLSLYSRSQSEYINCVNDLVNARGMRYELSKEKDDLDKSILYCTEAIFLPPVSQNRPDPNNVFQLLFVLAYALLERSEEFEQSEGIEYSVKYLRYLRGFPLDSYNVPKTLVTRSLVRPLGLQVKSEDGGGSQNIKEMVALCRELLTSNFLADFPTAAFGYLRAAADAEFRRGLLVELLDEVIECNRDAVKKCPPGSYSVLYALASTLYLRFLKTHSKEDYEEAMALTESALDSDESGECPDPFRAILSSFSTVLAYAGWVIFQKPEYSERAISCLRADLSSPPIDDVLHFKSTGILSRLTRQRFEDYSLSESLEEAKSHVSYLVESSSVETSGELSWSEAVRETYSAAEIQQRVEYLEKLLSITPPGTERHKEFLIYLEEWYESKFHRTKDISDLKEAIKYCRLSLNSTHASDPWKINPLLSLRHNLLLAFDKTEDIGYLNESITISYDILELDSQTVTQTEAHFRATERLVNGLLIRNGLLGRREDLLEAIRLISVFVNNPYAHEHKRFQLSCWWTRLARRIDHPTTLTAYKIAMSLMQKSVSVAPTISVQHGNLVAMAESSQTMPLDYASFLINLGQFEEAVETLEQGRALLWSEMRDLRVLDTQLIEEDPPLAKRLSQKNQELEALTISITPSGRSEIEDGVAQGRDGTDPFGRLVIKRQKVMKERDALILQIQNRPGLEGFLRAPSFAALRTAASHGPVIIINHCEWHSDLVIIFHNYLPCAIPTADDFYERAKTLRDELVEARKHGLDSKEYQDALCSVLKGLYEIVGEPVIKRLRLLGVPEQSRIWWCPTSVFCSLPLHAMGPIPSNDTCKRYFSDLYIPSYTPSLSALIESRKASPQILGKPSLLLVAQPDDSLPGVTGEIKIILERALKARVAVTDLVSSEATPSSVLEGLRGSRLAHFACHGVLEAGKPFEASFKLHDGSHLTLLDIVRSRLPDAEFAFLSCCHAAEITAGSISDEALHLTAAMQYCGFRSVVGTMWEMADTDGRDLAKNFYRSLFSKQDSSVPYYERSAIALRDATQKLRGKRGISLERWVNFVHYGA